MYYLFLDEVLQVQCIKLKYSISMSLKMSYVPGTELLLFATGLEYNTISLYVQQEIDDLNFIKVNDLEGHENWVRGLDFKSLSKFRTLYCIKTHIFIYLYSINLFGVFCR